MTTTVLLTGERHRVAPGERGRVVTTRCGLTVARIGSPLDPSSAYQRAVFPLAAHPIHPKPCTRYSPEARSADAALAAPEMEAER